MMLKISTGQGHGQVTWGQVTMSWGKLHESRATHFNKVILDVESNGNSNFDIWPEGQVKNDKK